MTHPRFPPPTKAPARPSSPSSPLLVLARQLVPHPPSLRPPHVRLAVLPLSQPASSASLLAPPSLAQAAHHRWYRRPRPVTATAVVSVAVAVAVAAAVAAHHLPPSPLSVYTADRCPLRSLFVRPVVARPPPVVCAHSPVSPPPLAPAPAPRPAGPFPPSLPGLGTAECLPCRGAPFPNFGLRALPSIAFPCAQK